MSNRTPKRISNSANYCYIIIYAIMLLWAAKPGLLWSQRRTSSRTAGKSKSALQQEAEIVQTIFEKILSGYVSPMKTLGAEDIDIIVEENLKKSKNYYRRFKPIQKAHFDMVNAYLSHYTGDGEKVLKHLRQAMKNASKNISSYPDISDSCILLALIWGDYDMAARELQRRAGGKVAREEYNSSYDSYQMAGRQNLDQFPQNNDLVNPSESSSEWNFQRIDESAKKSPTSPRNNVRSGKRDGNVSLTGRSYGGITPTNPGILGPGGNFNSSRGRKRTSYGGNTAKQAEVILKLPVAYMPFEFLGKPFPKVRLHNTNGSYFYFEPGKGQILCALLWAVPPDQSSTNTNKNTRSRHTASRTAPWEMSHMAKSARRGRKTSSSTKTEDDFLASGDLNKNMEQFKKLFQRYGPIRTGGRMQFVGINLNEGAMAWGLCLKMLNEKSWPWSNCLAEQAINREQLSASIEKASPVMMIVGTEGKIRYIGPVGGLLPRIILNQELPKTTIPNLNQVSFQSLPSGTKPTTKSRLGKIVSGGSGKTNSVANNSTTTEKPKPNRASIETRKKTNVFEAEQELTRANQLKTIKKYPDALKKCDDIIQKWPDSLEADKAKELIKSILRNNKSLKNRRQNEGKYVGD